MIHFEEDRRGLVLEYEPEFNDPSWVSSELKKNGEVTISRGFTFKATDMLRATSTPRDQPNEPVYRFRFARKEADYYRIPGRILGCDQDVLIVNKGVPLDRRTFVAERNVGIFRRIAKVKNAPGDIVVGGSRKDSIPADVFLELLGKFPRVRTY